MKEKIKQKEGDDSNGDKETASSWCIKCERVRPLMVCYVMSVFEYVAVVVYDKPTRTAGAGTAF
jgi:hypothetical protein